MSFLYNCKDRQVLLRIILAHLKTAKKSNYCITSLENVEIFYAGKARIRIFNKYFHKYKINELLFKYEVLSVIFISDLYLYL